MMRGSSKQKQPPKPGDRNRGRRGAASMILVVGVMIIGTILVTQGVRSVVNQHRTMPSRFEQQQAAELLQIGIQQLEQVSESEDIVAGQWDVPVGILHARQSGRLLVSVQDNEVTLTAKYPWESDRPISLSHTISFSE